MQFADKLSDRLYNTSINIGEKVVSKTNDKIADGMNFADKFSDKIYSHSAAIGERVKSNIPVDQLNQNVLNDTVVSG